MFSLTKHVSSRVRIYPLKNLSEFIYQKPYSCLCAASSIKKVNLSNVQQNTQYTVGQDKYYVARRQIKLFSTKSENNILVYHGYLTTQIRVVKIFSICSSIAGLASQPVLYNHASELGGTGVVIAVGTIVGFFTFVTPLLIHLLTKKYVTDIHYNDTTGVYTATLLTFFLRAKKVSFTTEDVIVPDVPGLFTSFIAKNKALFVDPHQFEDPSYYGKLMGYDKPMDFLLKKDPLTDTVKEKSNK